MHNISESLIERQFFRTMEKLGIKPEHELILKMDGSIHRFETQEDKNGEKSGAYLIHADGCPNWGIQDFRKFPEMQLFKFDFSELTNEDKQEYLIQNNPAYRKRIRAETEARRIAEKKAEAEKLRIAYLYACSEYDHAMHSSADMHPYIKMKEYKDVHTGRGNISLKIMKYYDFNLFEPDLHNPYFGILPTHENPHTLGIVINPINTRQCEKGDLLIPLVNAETRKFQTLQIIKAIPNEQGKYPKMFYRGLPIQNACFEFINAENETAPFIYLAEGFITGASVQLITKGYPVVCAMNIGNLVNVAKSLRKRYPKKKIILFADNDAGTAIKSPNNANPGVNAAISLKRNSLVDEVKIPKIPGRENENVDWYDAVADKAIKNMAI